MDVGCFDKARPSPRSNFVNNNIIVMMVKMHFYASHETGCELCEFFFYVCENHF